MKKFKLRKPVQYRPSTVRPRNTRPINSSTIYKYKYLRSFLLKTLITVVTILILVIIKKTNFNPTNKVIEIIKGNIMYKVNIKDDSKRIYYGVEKVINKTLEAIPVFNLNKTEKLLAPIAGTVYKNYVVDLDDENTRENYGIDILSESENDNPKAIMDGVVKKIEIKGSKGYFVTIESDQIEFVYGYLSRVYVKVDSVVKVGDIIGAIGTNKDGMKYLRFEIYVNGKSMDPLDYIEID